MYLCVCCVRVASFPKNRVVPGALILDRTNQHTQFIPTADGSRNVWTTMSTKWRETKRSTSLAVKTRNAPGAPERRREQNERETTLLPIEAKKIGHHCDESQPDFVLRHHRQGRDRLDARRFEYLVLDFDRCVDLGTKDWLNPGLVGYGWEEGEETRVRGTNDNWNARRYTTDKYKTRNEIIFGVEKTETPRGRGQLQVADEPTALDGCEDDDGRDAPFLRSPRGGSEAKIRKPTSLLVSFQHVGENSVLSAQTVIGAMFVMNSVMSDMSRLLVDPPESPSRGSRLSQKEKSTLGGNKSGMSKSSSSLLSSGSCLT